MRDVKRGTRTAAVGAVVIALAGCGAVDSVRYPYAKESADRIFLDSVVATKELTSVRLSGFLDKRGEPRLGFNLLDAEGGVCGGTMSFSTADFDVVLTSDTIYFQGSAGSWQQFPEVSREEAIAVAPILADRWISAPLDKAPGPDPGPACRFVEELLTPAEQKAVDEGEVPENLEVTNEGLSEAAGMKAVKLEVVDKSGSSDVWVSVDEPHYIIKIAGQAKKGSFDIVFSDYDFQGEIRVPRKKELLDLDELTAEDLARGSA